MCFPDQIHTKKREKSKLGGLTKDNIIKYPSYLSFREGGGGFILLHLVTIACLRLYILVNNFSSFWDGCLGLSSTKQWG